MRGFAVGDVGLDVVRLLEQIDLRPVGVSKHAGKRALEPLALERWGYELKGPNGAVPRLDWRWYQNTRDLLDDAHATSLLGATSELRVIVAMYRDAVLRGLARATLSGAPR